MKTTYTTLATLETRYGLSTTQLYKLLEGLHLRPKRTLAACYLNDLQVKELEEWIEKSIYTYQPLLELSQILESAETTYLYQCTNCRAFWLSSSLHEDSLSLHHICAHNTGRYRLLAAGPHEEMGYLAQLIQQGKWDGTRQQKRQVSLPPAG